MCSSHIGHFLKKRRIHSTHLHLPGVASQPAQGQQGLCTSNVLVPTKTYITHLGLGDRVVLQTDKGAAGIMHLKVFLRKNTLAQHLLGEAALDIHHQLQHLREYRQRGVTIVWYFKRAVMQDLQTVTGPKLVNAFL